MANMHLVTGHGGQNHVTAADQGSLNAAILGNGEYVLGRGSKLAATIVSNNCIRIADGDILMQGRHIRLNEGSYVDLTIENGEQGKLRHDLIVCRYTMNSLTGVEEANLVVIKGAAVESNPQDPEYTSADIITDHAFLADMPLYRVPLDNLNVGELVPLFTVTNGVATLDADGKLAQMPTLEDIGAAASDHTHTAKDVGAATADHTHTATEIGAATNPNLLDNWYFAAPVNQRGQTNYSGAGYNIDRWKYFEPGATLQIVSGGVKLIRPQSNVAWGTLVEGYHRFTGKQVTLSFLTDKGLYSASVVLPEVKPQGEHYPLCHSTDIGHISIGIWDGLDGVAAFLNNAGAVFSEITVFAAKLELGSQQTLARQENGVWVLNDPPPNQATETFKCTASTIDAADAYANGGSAFIKGTAAMTAGTTALASGTVYLQYE